jgi:hypothetical protein
MEPDTMLPAQLLRVFLNKVHQKARSFAKCEILRKGMRSKGSSWNFTPREAEPDELCKTLAS